MPHWHAEVVELALRRYPRARSPDEAAEAWEAGLPYDGTATARIAIGRAVIGPMLVVGSAIARPDRRQLADILRAHGATSLEITRHGVLVVRRE